MSTLTTTSNIATPASTTPTTIRGTPGNDILVGGAGRDIIDGGDGDDLLRDIHGDNQLLGGAGDDTLIGSGIFNGGPGDDAIDAGGDSSGNVYQYAKGDGFDTISTDTRLLSWPPQGMLQFGQGVTPSSVDLVRDDDHLSFCLSPTDQVVLLDWFKGPAFQLAQVSFADGTTWETDDINAMGVTVFGTEHQDMIEGYAGDDRIHAGAGIDRVLDGQGYNFINGDAGNDWLMGCGVLNGGQGNDILVALGPNTEDNFYLFDIGDGRDTLYAKGDLNLGRPQGTVAFGNGLDSSRLWFRRQDDDLAVTVVGSHEGMTIKDWYLDQSSRVAQFISGDDKILGHDKVDALVQAMAAFTPPVTGDNQLDQTLNQALAPVLATSWT